MCVEGFFSVESASTLSLFCTMPHAYAARASRCPRSRYLVSRIGLPPCQGCEGKLSDSNTGRRGAMSEATLKLRVYEGLKQVLLSGQLRHGQKLAARDLRERLERSRTPIREALGRLVPDRPGAP